MPAQSPDVVADVVRDHSRVARIVLGDASLDLSDEVGADVGGLGVDAAAEPREDRDERPAEGQPDQSSIAESCECPSQPVRAQ